MPQPKLPKAPLMKARVMALERPARDQPVAAPIGASSTAREKIVPIATQPSSAPAATSPQLRSMACGAAGRDPWERAPFMRESPHGRYQGDEPRQRESTRAPPAA